MKNETIKKIELKLADEVLKANMCQLKFSEIVDLMKATTTFQAVVKIISNHNGGLTVSELEENSKLLLSIYINCYRLNKRTKDVHKLIKI